MLLFFIFLTFSLIQSPIECQSTQKSTTHLQNLERQDNQRSDNAPAHLIEGIWSPPNPSIRFSPTFHIQMHNITFQAIHSSNLSIFVLDAHAAAFTPAQVATLRGQNKTLLAYLSLGEAENFRRYWQPFWANPDSGPDFLVTPFEADSAQTGKYRTKFWKLQWQRIVLRFMQEHILPWGYSGLFLDALDAYQYFTDDASHDSQAEMIAFVRLTRNQARLTAPDLKVFANNVPELYEVNSFKGLVDGLAVSETWFKNGDTALSGTNLPFVENVLKWTRLAKADGKTVLAVDFPTLPENVCTFYERCTEEGFSCAVTDYAFSGVTRVCEQRRPTTVITNPTAERPPSTSSGSTTKARYTTATTGRLSSTSGYNARAVENFLVFFAVALLSVFVF
ncbi:hypothetical protein BV898_08661 [Hypsibius exemplaris]|uniref:Glycoside-hydrolase family GH114 TIM-barrel domain-containing protein n=1 Tax=Hypsibius exemplaris TaxID=2072580 RepID=A0A1W0WQ33_HYPEX|nr:hypothetical protein BV898_08661 [Hypsibius exemplaris]